LRFIVSIRPRSLQVAGFFIIPAKVKIRLQTHRKTINLRIALLLFVDRLMAI
jgi:hypothetical protein